MKLVIQKTNQLKGTLVPPCSKSHAIRGLVLGLLSEGTTTLHNIILSDDISAAIEACKALGADISQNGTTITIDSTGASVGTNIQIVHTHNSGVTTRFLLPVLGLRDSEEPILLDVSEQMSKRPMHTLVGTLNQLGMQITPAGGASAYPLSVAGKLTGGTATVDGTSSQYISALLMSLPLAEKDSTISVENLQERPYMEMTLRWLDELGIRYEHIQDKQKDTFNIPGGQTYRSFTKTIPADFSSLSYALAAGVLLPGTVEIQNIDMDDTQPDKRLVEILQEMGANIAIQKDRLIIQSGDPLKGIEIDANDIPDMVPTLAVVATQAEGETKIHNVAHARIKETDRIRSMYTELRAMGADIEEHEDGLTIRRSELTGNRLYGYGDHRTVMALTVAAMLAKGETCIHAAEAINKTYPGFVQDMQHLGVEIKTTNTRYMQHIILIGFKHAGKSVIGTALAEELSIPCIDTDLEIEKLFESRNGTKLTCRQIAVQEGLETFRDLESEVLQTVLRRAERTIIATGGGAPLRSINRDLIREHTVVHVDAPRGHMLERIMQDGRPAFCPKDQEPLIALKMILEERDPIYRELAHVRIVNDGSIAHAVEQVVDAVMVRV